MGGVLTAATVVYLVTSSVQNAFIDVINETGLVYAGFYVLTALATIVYFRRRIVRNASDFIVLGVLPIIATAFLVWLVYKSVLVTTNAENIALEIVFGVGVLLILVARFILRSPFFRVPLESAGEQ